MHVTLDDYKPAPEWMTAYVGALATITQHKRPWRVVTAPPSFFADIPKSKSKAEGALMQLEDGTDVIVMPEWAVATEYWCDILAHEFAHALHSQIDRMVADLVPSFEQYEVEVERFATLLGGLMQFAAIYARFNKSGSITDLVFRSDTEGSVK